MKRGLPIEESNASRRRESQTSIEISPQTMPYSTIPPPAKRHQTSHPAETPPTRPPDPPHYLPQSIDRNPYSYYSSPAPQQAPPPHPAPYHNAPPYQYAMHNQSPTMAHHQRPPDSYPYGPNGHGTPNHPPPPTSSFNTAPPPPQSRQVSSHYDTRPPPPMPSSSGFTTVNQPPPSSGFAAVNSRPPAGSPGPEVPASKAHKPSKGSESTPARPSVGGEDRTHSGNSSSKRTPSTTHPYQMSEAFANRHHHCERTDGLNRGIWTWYGPGGKDHPTEPPTEMYLRCNHDGCRRIDWRTVHGLQCHIVKNHEQPKGTIGSLEKALAGYGVPVKEVEATEEMHGPGSGGTMADPKNNKFRARKTAAERRALTPADDKSTSLVANRSVSPSSILLSHQKQHHSLGDHIDSESDGAMVNGARIEQHRPSGGFAAVNASWKPINSGHKRQHSNDMEVRAAPTSVPSMHHQPDDTPSKPPLPFWSSWQGTEVLPTHNRPPSSHVPQTPSFTPAAPSHAIAPASPEDKIKREIAEEHQRQAERADRDSAIAIKQMRSDIDEMVGTASINNTARIDAQPPQAPPRLMHQPDIEPIPDTSMPDVPKPLTDAQPEKPPPSLQPAPELRKHSPTPQASQPTSAEKTDQDHLMTDAKDHEEDKPTKSPATPIAAGRTSRRASRRTSIATTSQAGTERSKEEDAEKDEDGDTIVVAKERRRKETKGEEKEDEMTSTTPARRLANGRFTRNKR